MKIKNDDACRSQSTAAGTLDVGQISLIYSTFNPAVHQATLALQTHGRWGAGSERGWDWRPPLPPCPRAPPWPGSLELVSCPGAEHTQVESVSSLSTMWEAGQGAAGVAFGCLTFGSLWGARVQLSEGRQGPDSPPRPREDAPSALLKA